MHPHDERCVSLQPFAGDLMNKHDDSMALVSIRVDGFMQRHARAIDTLTMLLTLAICVLPDLAFAQTSGSSASSQLSTNATTAVNYIKTGVYFILIVGVLGAAVSAAFGRMEWMTVGKVLIGCVIAGLATDVVGGLSGLSGT
jgi:type IV secretory pathway VirB2 component (pilin)